MRRKIVWVAVALVLIAIPALIGLVAFRGDDDGSSSASRRAAALIAAGGGGFELKVEGLLPAGDPRVIDVMSWSWGVSNSGTAYSASTGGAGTGKTQFNEFNITKSVDSASPKLFLNCTKGTLFTKVTLTGRKAGETAQEYLVITLEQVLITSVQLAGSGPGDELPTEQVSLNFAKATIETTELNDAGKAESAPVIHFYDLRTAKAG
jgi:type VI secretion system secreted protein Hcp